ncbi:filamentous hemagglutinin family outer membrane protein, partial [Acetonema longum]
QTLEATPTQSDAAKPTVALDVGALGGMYAGKIKLIGTEKGLGVTLDGEVAASQNLILTHDGRITVNGSLSAQQDIEITASGDLANDGQISSGQTIRIAARHIQSNGFITAGEEGEEDHTGHEHGSGEESGGSTPILADLTLTAAETVDLTGVVSASRNVILSGKTVTYDADNTF